MVAAAAAGAAPLVHYSDPATGVAIMDFVSGRPLSEHPGGPVGMVRALGALISKVQATPPFPMLGDYPEVIGSMLGSLSKSSFFTAEQLDPYAEGFARIWAALIIGTTHPTRLSVPAILPRFRSMGKFWRVQHRDRSTATW